MNKLIVLEFKIILFRDEIFFSKSYFIFYTKYKTLRYILVFFSWYSWLRYLMLSFCVLKTVLY